MSKIKVSEFSIATVEETERIAASMVLRGIWSEIKNEAKPQIGATGYLDIPVRFKGSMAKGTDKLGRKAIYFSVKVAWSDGDWEHDQVSVFERHPGSNIWVSGTPGDARLFQAEAGGRAIAIVNALMAGKVITTCDGAQVKLA